MPQSTLHTAGREAEMIAELFWWLAGVGLVVWLLVVGLAIYASHTHIESLSRRKASILIIGGGALMPTLILAGFLIYGLRLIPAITARAEGDPLKLEVTGEQWWWRVRYLHPDGSTVELANEVRLPRGVRTEILLKSPDVIHSFWIPSLGGKMDMIPGRVNRLSLEPTQTGVFRGACAEYCGTSHALMSLYAVVMEPPDFERWLEVQSMPASHDAGQDLFVNNGCGACHAIRGTPADGVVGPDLTHVGSRTSLGAGILPNDPNGFVRWISETDNVKPDAHMPSFGMLERRELRALAAYLDGLE